MLSQEAMEIEEQLVELGYKDLAEAEADGYHITYTDNRIKLCMDMNKEADEN